MTKMKFNHIGSNSCAGYFQFATLGSGLHILTLSGLLPLTPTLVPSGLEVTSSCWYQPEGILLSLVDIPTSVPQLCRVPLTNSSIRSLMVSSLPISWLIYPTKFCEYLFEFERGYPLQNSHTAFLFEQKDKLFLCKMGKTQF